MGKINFDKHRAFTDEGIDKLFNDMNVFDYAEIVNGCGSDFMFDKLPYKMALAISNASSCRFYKACAKHDLYCGYLGGSDADCKAGNKIFREEMQAIADEEKIVLDIALTILQKIYGFLVDLFKREYFNHWNDKGGIIRTSLPSYHMEKSVKIFDFEERHNVIFIWYQGRYILKEEDYEKVKGIFTRSI